MPIMVPLIVALVLDTVPILAAVLYPPTFILGTKDIP
jgi:hypothetical protein